MSLAQILDLLELRAIVESLARFPILFIFSVSILLSIILGRSLPRIIRYFTARFSSKSTLNVYDTLTESIAGSIRLAGTFVLISLSFVWIEEKYSRLHAFLNPFVTLMAIATVAWACSRIFRQVVRIYGIDLFRRSGRQVDDLLLVFETFVNIVIGFIAALAFAQSQQFNLVGLLASLGLSGLAVAFAAQKILEQLLSTIVLYLDRPFVPGEYIRLANGQLGRVESIGLRSTKIRTPAKSTLLIIPNSNLVSMEIENVTRAKKVMVMLYLNFTKAIDRRESALVKQVISESTNSVFGIDPGSTNVAFTPKDAEKYERARITFFILGSSESSIALRKRLLELANKAIAQKLETQNIGFTTDDPTVYVESPVTL